MDGGEGLGFLEDGVGEEEKLGSYGSLSDGLTHFLVNKMLAINLTIYEVRHSQILPYNYPTTNPYKSPTASLLYHHNHYDLL